VVKIAEQCLLFRYIDGQFAPLSKPFTTKAQAEKARLKLPERERRSVAVGVIRIKKYSVRGWDALGEGRLSADPISSNTF
jgi:hypothetical protein